MRFSRLALLVSTIWATSAGAQTQVAEFEIVPCSPTICGGFPANQATLQTMGGVVKVFRDGRVDIRIGGLSDIGSPDVRQNLDLTVFFGSFTPGHHSEVRLGTVRSGSDGNITASLGPVLAGGVKSGQFIFNTTTPARSQFITGFVTDGGPPRPRPQCTPPQANACRHLQCPDWCGSCGCP